MTRVHLIKVALIACFCFEIAVASPGQTLTTLFSFNGTDGSSPTTLIQGIDGNFYGTTAGGGSPGGGTFFRMDSADDVSTLYNFCSQNNCADGAGPNTLMQTQQGNFYGLTVSGGTAEAGTAFEITGDQNLTVLHSFCTEKNCSDGEFPNPGLLYASNGNFYGATMNGGGCCGYGVLFRLSPAGKFATIHSFNQTDGSMPNGGLIENGGFLYGTTINGGAYLAGTVFRTTMTGKGLTLLYSFCRKRGRHNDLCLDGEGPSAGLLKTKDGSLYGTTIGGGTHANAGTIFKITLEGKLTRLYSFCAQSACTDGESPTNLIEGLDGNLYGLATAGGAYGEGAIFSITPEGKFTGLYSFCSQRTKCTDGALPASLMQIAGGMFYGTTSLGGANDNCNANEGCGTIFSFSAVVKP
jgi:uncharacterized repeat protein (TIGR03803 family)